MKRFVFRLESVLGFRRHELQRSRRTLGRALERIRSIEASREGALRAASESAADWIARARRGIASERMGLAQIGIEQAFSRWRHEGLRLEAARDEAQRARGEVVAAHTRVRALEKLRERALERHRLESLREEARELDEVAGRRRSLVEPLPGAPDDVRKEAS